MSDDNDDARRRDVLFRVGLENVKGGEMGKLLDEVLPVE